MTLLQQLHKLRRMILMYMFISMYNRLFLIYVLLMSASLFVFILILLDFDIKNEFCL